MKTEDTLCTLEESHPAHRGEYGKGSHPFCIATCAKARVDDGQTPYHLLDSTNATLDTDCRSKVRCHVHRSGEPCCVHGIKFDPSRCPGSYAANPAVATFEENLTDFIREEWCYDKTGDPQDAAVNQTLARLAIRFGVHTPRE